MPRDETFTFRISEIERTILAGLADYRNVSQSEVLRQLIRDAGRAFVQDRCDKENAPTREGDIHHAKND